MLPFAKLNGIGFDFFDALFNSTSAVCTVGVTTVNYNEFSPIGKGIMIFLMQVGSMGVITIIIGLGIILQKKSIDWFIAGGGIFEYLGIKNISIFIKVMIFFSFFIEILGALAYKFFGFINGLNISFQDSLLMSVSMFCNNGFSLLDQSYFEFFQTRSYYLIGIFLMIAGSLGYLFFYEIYKYFKNKKNDEDYFFSLTTRVSIFIYFITTFICWFLVFITQENTFSSYSLIRSFFCAVSIRGCGMIPYLKISILFLFFSSLYAVIGTCPLATGGGLKTSALAVILYTPYSLFKKYNNIVIMERIIPWKKVLYSYFYLFLLIFSSILFFILHFKFYGLSDNQIIPVYSNILGMITSFGGPFFLNNIVIDHKVLYFLSILTGKIISLLMGIYSSFKISKNSIYQVFPDGKLFMI